MTARTKVFIASFLLWTLSSASSLAFNDYAPAPRRAPREPVAKQTLTTPSRQPSVPSSRLVEGSALILDSEKLRVDGLDLRLFGVVPPQLSASFGPQARALLDKATANAPVHCRIRDRGNDSRLLATCTTSSGADLAQELLRHGLAVTARGSLMQTELAAPYAAAEQAAQAQKIGLWSGATASAPAVSISVKNEPAVTKDKEEPAAPTTTEEKAEQPAAQQTTTKTEEAQKKADEALFAPPPVAAVETTETSSLSNIAERYQLLLTGTLMLLTALSIMGVIFFQRRLSKREEICALAAALRGELMSARAVCLTRIQEWSRPDAEKAGASWPRIRVLVFQSHVGRIGWLGAELARQVASIYGLASDYASYYQSHSSEASSDITDKKQALQKLVGYIDTVLPRLAAIENAHMPFGLFKKMSTAPALAPAGQPPVMPPAIDVSPAPLPIAAAPKEMKAEEKKETSTATAKADKGNDNTPPNDDAGSSGTSEPSKKKTEESSEKAEKKETAERQEAVPASPVLLAETKTSAWSRLKQIKDFVQNRLAPVAIPHAHESDDYLAALLKAESEAFSTYDFSAAEVYEARPTRRQSMKK